MPRLPFDPGNRHPIPPLDDHPVREAGPEYALAHSDWSRSNFSTAPIDPLRGHAREGRRYRQPRRNRPSREFQFP